jgi:cell division protein FtsN
MKFYSFLIVFAIGFSSCNKIKSLIGSDTNEDTKVTKVNAKRKKTVVEQNSTTPKKLVNNNDSEKKIAKNNRSVNRISKGNYYIIVGSFKNRPNANSLIKKLEYGGYSPTIIKTKKGFYRVAIDSYSNWNVAFKDLTNIRSKHSRTAWICKKY